MAIQLHQWQTTALEKWHFAGRQGIIEAVTGSGKTYVAFGALEQLQTEDKRLNTLIVDRFSFIEMCGKPVVDRKTLELAYKGQVKKISAKLQDETNSIFDAVWK